MNRFRKPLIISVLFLFSACGIEEYYFLPQVPENYITRSLTDTATITLPSIDQYYYATNYSIYYRIYMTSVTLTTIQTSSDRNSINPELSRDFNSLSRYTDTTDTLVTTENTFKNLNYYEIELDGRNIADIFSKNGGALRIFFPNTPGSYPTVSLNNGNEIRLLRSGQLTSARPENDLSFRNSDELNNNVNADVAVRTGGSSYSAYVSMYIVAKGYNSELFSQIYGKPTHINIFKLPDIN